MRVRTKCVIISLLMAEQSVEDSTMSVTATGVQLRRECPKLLYRVMALERTWSAADPGSQEPDSLNRSE
jgi:hypothetical protein